VLQVAVLQDAVLQVAVLQDAVLQVAVLQVSKPFVGQVGKPAADW
jgi:hypothetical protein